MATAGVHSLTAAVVGVVLLPLLFCSAAFSPDDSPGGQRLLVLLDDLAIRSTHSVFFASLKSRGFDLEFRLADDPALALKRFGQFRYDGLILFSPSAKRFGGSVDLAGVLEFVDSGRNLILAADASASELMRDIAVECGVDFDEDASAVVIDHTSYAVSDTDGDHTLIAADEFIEADVILGDKKIEAPVLFKGVAHSLSPANSMVLKVLSASKGAYSANPKAKLTKPPTLTGNAISLVSAMQARNNARVLVSGSLSLFSDRLIKSGVQKSGTSNKHVKSGNEQFVTELSKWVFHERGHLKAINVKHSKVGEDGEPSMYRINDDLEYSVEIYEWSGNSWKPYLANDVQVQFYMMSPYVLKNLSNNEKGLYHTSFKVPDVYGVFQFKIEYQRLGFTSLSLAKQIPVRPFRHNEYERFIPAAYPYYGASFSMMAGFFVFSVAYLYHK